jgi:hypothetical protein
MAPKMLALYPEANYTSAGLRFSDIAQSIEITGRNLAVTNALGNNTWNAENMILPATHFTDQAYYWYAATKMSASSLTSAPIKSTLGAANVPTAQIMQKYLLSFVITGDPNTLWANDTGKTYWPKYNERAAASPTVMLFNTNNMTLGGDDLATGKSLFWNKALWY